MSDFRKKNHYVSKSYLKAWSNKNKKIFSYRILVSHEKVPLWNNKSIKNLAYHKHLYTLINKEDNSDEIERWMDQEIEAPAQKALKKVRSDENLKDIDLNNIIRFMALQDVRTPIRYMEHIKRSQKQMPEVVKKVSKQLNKVLEESNNPEDLPKLEKHSGSNMIPMNVEKEIVKNSDQGYLKTDILFGRSSWLFMIRHLLNKTYKILKEHNWNIIKAPDEMEWLTSDNPVIKLNYYGKGKYDFKGGWGNEGTEIIFPLSPNHLLYTQIGKETYSNQISLQLAHKIQRFIAENAHRFIFSADPIDDIEKIRPRIVDSDAFKKEKKAWENWHDNQKKAKLDMIMNPKNNFFREE